MNIEEMLIERYRAFENIDAGWDFFLYLNDYINFIYETQETNKIIKKIEKQKSEEYKNYYLLKDKVAKEIGDSKKKLLMILKKNEFDEDSFKSIEELNAYKRGLNPKEDLAEKRIMLTGLRVENDNKIFSDIVRELLSKDYGKLVEKFTVGNSKINNTYVDEKISLSKTYKEFLNEKERLNNIKKDKIWHCWWHLKYIPEIFNSDGIGFIQIKDDIEDEISEEDTDYIVKFGIISSTHKSSNYAFEPDTSKGFEKEIKIYKKWAKRLHLYILEELLVVKALVRKEKNIKTSYENGVLSFRGTKFNFGSKQLQKTLLDTLFKKPKNNWSNDEIWEDWGEPDLIGKTLKFYTAGDEINKAIAMELKIKDFIVKTTKDVRINPKYV